ncbi:MAG: carbon-nitrogen hydrolase family protein [Bdellovibrio sp.]|nr:carbon-nitrogen hydrolase family protein [Bdellovibrio sp.]
MSSELVVAVVQMTSVDEIDTNLQQLKSALDDIFKHAQPRLVSFPENCLYLRLVEGEKVAGLQISHPVFAQISKWAQQYNTHLHLGSVPLLVDGHLYNSSVLVRPTGEVEPTYKKLHLFDIQLDGQQPMRESDVFRHGQKPSVIDVDGWRIGEAICYDVRFSELFSQYAQQEVDVILVPAAFLVKTGEAHWEVLLRARAIESQSYVLASAQGGTHIGPRGGQRDTYGHSLIIDPWGVIIGQVAELKPGFVISTLSRAKIDKVRSQIPMKAHRRLQLPKL